MSVKNALKSRGVQNAIFYISLERISNFWVATLNCHLRQFGTSLAQFLVTKNLYWPPCSFGTFLLKIGHFIQMNLIFKVYMTRLMKHSVKWTLLACSLFCQSTLLLQLEYVFMVFPLILRIIARDWCCWITFLRIS